MVYYQINTDELAIMNAIIRYQEDNNQSPSIRQISDDTGVSKTYVYEYLKSLKNRGFVNYQDGKDCTVTVLTHEDVLKRKVIKASLELIKDSLERAKMRKAKANES
jgi:sugar-specific transcriptional regulator TrmB